MTEDELLLNLCEIAAVPPGEQSLWDSTVAACAFEVVQALQERIEELEQVLQPFVNAFPVDLDWYRRRHDLNVLSDMLSLPVPITPENIIRLHQVKDISNAPCDCEER